MKIFFWRKDTVNLDVTGSVDFNMPLVIEKLNQLELAPLFLLKLKGVF